MIGQFTAVLGTAVLGTAFLDDTIGLLLFLDSTELKGCRGREIGRGGGGGRKNLCWPCADSKSTPTRLMKDLKKTKQFSSSKK